MFTFMSGIKPTGVFHIGNYVNTIKPIIDNGEKNCIVLIADCHALTSHAEDIKEKTEDLIKVLYSFGIKNIVLQSWLPEIMELNWILSCFTSKGELNRAHGYKSMVEYNTERGYDVDSGVNMGLYSYPVLMSADLCIFDTDYVYIGKDQLQHVEIAKETIKKFNNHYNTNILKVPEPYIKHEYLISGYDGRKMSKSYNNTIPVMSSREDLKKHIFSIKTNSKNVGEPKEWDDSPITQLYSCFASKKECNELREKMKQGEGWGQIKSEVLKKVEYEFEFARDVYFTINSLYIRNFVLDRIYHKTKKYIRNRIGELKELIYM